MSYLEDLAKASENIKNLKELKNKNIFITGAAGQIGKSLVSLFTYLNDYEKYNIKMILNTRSESRIKTTFQYLENRDDIDFYIGDITNEIKYDGEVDYIISAASNTHPKAYSQFPIETIMTNVIGAKNVFNFAIKKNARVIILSSVEIYGDILDRKPVKETDMGYIDSNTVRACYNESKRVSETLSQAYISEKNADVVIIRLPRLFGPETKKDDTKALSQFINNALNKEDIVLKSDGSQYFSYLYAPDAVSGILTVLINGTKGSAYNISSEKCDITLRDLAEKIAEKSKVKLVFDMPDEIELKGFSKAQYAILDSSKIRDELGWDVSFDIDAGLKKTLIYSRKLPE